MLNYELSNYTHEQLSAYTHAELAGFINGDSDSPIFPGLIVDRTYADVERWRLLRNKGWDNMTTWERQEWLGEIETTPAATKGMYTHRDLNRVENAVKAILSRFQEAGYKTPSLLIKTDWTYTDELRDTDMERYYSNIAAVRNLTTVFKDTPVAPSIGERLTYQRANDIEKILSDVNNAISNITQAWHYAGEIISGEV